MVGGPGSNLFPDGGSDGGAFGADFAHLGSEYAKPVQIPVFPMPKLSLLHSASPLQERAFAA